MICIVFDVGGTSLRAASYHAAGDRLDRAVRVPTPSQWNSPNPTMAAIWEHVCRTLESLARGILGGMEPDVVSVAFPGPIDATGGLLAAPTVWGKPEKSPFPLQARLSAIWPHSVVIVLNDMTAAGYRYVSQGLQDFCLLTVSSGIGHKVFLHGSPVTGLGGRGGEIGHLRVNHTDRALRCDCGLRGHLGAVASGRGVLNDALQLARRCPEEFARSMLSRPTDGGNPSFDTAALATAFRAGDEWVSRIIDRAAAYLGHALAAIHTTIGIERFVIVGGFAFALGDEFRRRLAFAASQDCWDLGQEWDSMITFGIEDDDAGLLGAGQYAMMVMGRNRGSQAL